VLQIPVNNNSEMLQSPLEYNHSRAELLRAVKVFVWDEVTMANQATFNCADETFRRCTGVNRPFGGKIVLLLGDFRQTCPVIRGGSRVQVVHASVKSSPLWHLFRTDELIHPWRNGHDLPFANFVDAVGQGAGPRIPLHALQIVHKVQELIDFVYPLHVLQLPLECLTRAILAPTNAQVDEYNTHVLNNVLGLTRTYFATDDLKESRDVQLPAPTDMLDYVAHHTPPGMPPHNLPIKTNAVFRLMRNLSIDRGLVKNVRVVVIDIGRRVITVRLLRGIGGQRVFDEEDILIPRITFTSELPSGYTLHRRQFPLAPAYATTFNSCQGMTLTTLGIDLTRDVFSHGQLYTALSRVRRRQDARVRLRHGEQTTLNVTYHDLLQ
jgi:ATP-dependent DNA helicase PIF1